VQNILRNTLRYQGLFAKAIDRLMPKPTKELVR
jgi:hypothetical protein